MDRSENEIRIPEAHVAFRLRKQPQVLYALVFRLDLLESVAVRAVLHQTPCRRKEYPLAPVLRKPDDISELLPLNVLGMSLLASVLVRFIDGFHHGCTAGFDSPVFVQHQFLHVDISHVRSPR